MSEANPGNLAAKVFRDPVHFLAFGFGAGLSPFAPGTMGTLVAMPLVWLASGLSLSMYLILVGLLIGSGVFICAVSAKRLGVHDHSGIVWDEIAGYFITMAAMPAGWMWMVLGFFLFRLFDVWKPWPISWVDRHVGGGLGIMLDDILAGLVSWAIMYFGISLWIS